MDTKRSVIVVAHPDDEVLWFSSILEEVDHVIFCYEDVPGNTSLTDARKKIVDAYPLENVSRLGLDETGVFNAANWEKPVVTAYGLETDESESFRFRHTAVALQLLQRLTDVLSDYDTVFTHNPWGEYGHEEHVQVCRAVQAAQDVLGFDCWHSGYVSARSYRLMSRYDLAYARSVTCPIDHALQEKYIAIYQQYGCWTWHDAWERFDEDIFFNDIKLKPGDHSATQQAQLNWVLTDRGDAFWVCGVISKEVLEQDAKFMVPRIVDGYALEKSGDHYLLAGGPRAGTVISNSAAMIIGLCDGTRSITEIADLLCYTYDADIIDIEDDIHKSLIESYRRNILTIHLDPFEQASSGQDRAKP